MDTSTTSSSAIRSMLADEAVAAALVPWACPCEFGRGGRYRLEELIGMGRRSFVYRARDSHMSSAGFDALVAIKITPGSPASEGDALAARRVSHPNVLQVLDRATDEGGASYLVAEYVDGGTLASRPVPWSPRQAAACIAKLARAVQAAHSAGVVHCDLKPSNILLTRSGEPKLADFDLSFSPANREDGHRGNLAFMAPEQFEGADNALAPAADVYGLGGLLYWLVGGRMPHGETIEQIAEFHRDRRAVPTLAGDRDLGAIVGRALQRDRAARYDSAGSMADDLDAWLGLRPIAWTNPGLARRARLLVRRNPIRAALVVAGTLALGAGAYIGYDKTIGARQRELETQRQVNEKTRAELAQVRGRLMAVIRGAHAMLDLRSGGGLERVLPTLYWLDWLRGQIVVNARGEIMPPPQRIESLLNLVDQAQAAGRGEETDALIARYALIGYLVEGERGTEALVHVEWLEQHWAPKLDPKDIVVLGLATFRRCAQAQVASLTSESIAAQVEQLKQARDRLRADGRSEALPAIVDKVILHLSEPPEGVGPKAAR